MFVLKRVIKCVYYGEKSKKQSRLLEIRGKLFLWHPESCYWINQSEKIKDGNSKINNIIEIFLSPEKKSDSKIFLSEFFLFRKLWHLDALK